MTPPQYLTPQDINVLPAKDADERVYYGKDQKQFIDIRWPKAGKQPNNGIVVIHGGCWTSTYASYLNTQALSDALRDEGYATFNIEYRCVDEVGGGWPGTFLDIGQAIDSIKAYQAQLNMTKLIALGHSAGGHLAFWSLVREQLSPSSDLYIESPVTIQGAISMGGSGDVLSNFSHFANVCGPQALTGLFNGTPTEVPSHYHQGSPASFLPIKKAQWFLTGVDDQAVPPSLANHYLRLANEKGDGAYVKTIELEACAHHEYNHPQKHVFPILIEALSQMIDDFR